VCIVDMLVIQSRMESLISHSSKAFEVKKSDELDHDILTLGGRLGSGGGNKRSIGSGGVVRRLVV
jgi:hypothetical protein